ncbi:hypothetical protein HDV05_001995 [Chytridiales sp. JEL 0842]|nr:hypothetical protein HDV05_001995 [Chytridiales sp. JEL 0842]
MDPKLFVPYSAKVYIKALETKETKSRSTPNKNTVNHAEPSTLAESFAESKEFWESEWETLSLETRPSEGLSLWDLFEQGVKKFPQNDVIRICQPTHYANGYADRASLDQGDQTDDDKVDALKSKQSWTFVELSVLVSNVSQELLTVFNSTHQTPNNHTQRIAVIVDSLSICKVVFPLACFALGAECVVIDASWPSARILKVLEIAGVDAVLISSKTIDLVQSKGVGTKELGAVCVVDLDHLQSNDQKASQQPSEDSKRVCRGDDDVAFVLFTSVSYSTINIAFSVIQILTKS